VVDAPDVAPRVRAALEAPARPQRRRGWYVGQAAAAFVIAFGLAAAVIGLAGPRTAEATDVASLVTDAQTRLHAVDATVSVTEYGWHPDVPERRYAGQLTYAAPETLGLALEDVTAYPASTWRPNDVTVVVDGERSWRSGLAGCPTAGLPDCTPEQPRTVLTRGREPFDSTDPVPLDLVLPVASFVVAGTEQSLGVREVAGRHAIGVEVTAAQIAPLLDGVLRTGNWREVHPTDRARVWLDDDVGVPLTVEVVAKGGFERDRWAAANGLDEQDGDTLLVWELAEVRINPDTQPGPLPPPTAGDADDLGLRPDVPGRGPTPRWLPEGMEAHRSGRVGEVDVASWSDGTAWLKIRSTTAWRGGRLFGQDDAVVRRVEFGDSGVGYLVEGGRRVHVHAPDVDVEVTGSLPSDVLLRVAASLGVPGRVVPPDWAEAATATIDAAVEALPGLLVLPDGIDGFVGPAVTVTDGTAVLTYSGGGTRAFTLAQSRGEVLGPPVDDVVMSVEVRGLAGRFTPARGALEWVEGGRVTTLRSRTLGLAELLTIAAALEPTP